jgi:PKD repeat protein
VGADASASTDPQGQALTYSFAWGDGTSTGTQSTATAGHTFSAAGSYTVTVTVTDSGGLSSTATQTVTATSPSPPPAADPAFVNTVATNYSTSSKTSGSITVWRPAGVQAGDLVVLSVQLVGTASTGAVTGTDTAGNTYTTAADVSDASGNRLLVLSGVAASPLAVNDKITVTFPTAAGGYRITGDEFAGATRPDRSSTATGTGSTYSSGLAQATVGNEIAYGAVSLPSATANPTWASGWKDLGSAAVGSRYLGRAYQLPASGGYAATGTATGAWLAAVVTLRQ